MKKSKTSFLRELLSENKKYSMMRFCSLLIVVAGLSVIIYQAISCDDVDWTGCCSLITIALAGKTVQKVYEN